MTGNETDAEKRGGEKWQGESCQVRMTLAQSSCLGKFGGNGDGCGGGGWGVTRLGGGLW